MEERETNPKNVRAGGYIASYTGHEIGNTFHVTFVTIPVHLISLPLQLPDDRHVLVTFPVKLVYPVWQEYEQFDPYVLVQGMVSDTALGGVVN